MMYYFQIMQNVYNFLYKGIERCKECKQVLHKDDIKMFEGDPDDAVRLYSKLKMNFNL